MSRFPLHHNAQTSHARGGSYQHRFAAAIEEGKLLPAAELTQQIGKNEKYVRFRIPLSDAIPTFKEALRKEKITLGHALLRMNLPQSFLRTSMSAPGSRL